MEYTRDENVGVAPHIELWPIRRLERALAQRYEGGLLHSPRSLVRADIVATAGVVAVTVARVECVDTWLAARAPVSAKIGVHSLNRATRMH